jgi:hypothetical protein
MSPTKIMLIRHAEKPIPDGAPGLDPKGKADPESLSAIGWDRAKKLADFFSKPTAKHIEKPDFVFAAAPEVGSKRPTETVTPLVAALWPQAERANHFNDAIPKENVTALASAVLEANGVVLVCWEHTLIHAAVAALPKGPATPAKWPGGRFDVVWILKAKPGGWDFDQTPQMLRATDENSVIPF